MPGGHELASGHEQHRSRGQPEGRGIHKAVRHIGCVLAVHVHDNRDIAFAPIAARRDESYRGADIADLVFIQHETVLMIDLRTVRLVEVVQYMLVVQQCIVHALPRTEEA